MLKALTHSLNDQVYRFLPFDAIGVTASNTDDNDTTETSEITTEYQGIIEGIPKGNQNK